MALLLSPTSRHPSTPGETIAPDEEPAPERERDGLSLARWNQEPYVSGAQPRLAIMHARRAPRRMTNRTRDEPLGRRWDRGGGEGRGGPC